MTGEHPRGWRITERGTRTFRGGCTCRRCALRRLPGALADAAFGLGLGIALWRSRGRR